MVIDKMVNINIMSVCKMTRLVLPGMLERSKGVILNISSAAGMYPTPLLTLYSATKAFVDYFSRGLHAEYKSKGIIVQSVLPYYVATKMSKIRKPTFDKPSPETYVRAALGTVGLQSQTNGCLPHALMGWIFSLLPTPAVINLLMKTNKQVRARYLRKMKEKYYRGGEALQTKIAPCFKKYMDLIRHGAVEEQLGYTASVASPCIVRVGGGRKNVSSWA
ncbi:PREDICTED: estradiol 17-beta-dehydrogenase 12, partial [Eurypyga helias]|uniref:estradiol 17-beta-dehydrogenase 12 n=1 Tax=Eurypyga helias TaxID=54383 RepID=UPI000528B8D0